MNGRRGDAGVDRWRELFDRNRRDRELKTERLKVRAEQPSGDFDVDTGVIHREALERQRKKDSEPPSGKLGLALRFKAWPQVAALTILAALVAFLAWLKFGQ